MIQIVIAAAVALLLGAFATEVQSRLFAGQYFATLVMTVIAVFIGALVTYRSAAVVAAAGRRRHAATAADGRRDSAAADGRSSSAAPMDQRESGRVKWFNRSKGFGFIIRDSGGEVFVHHRNIQGGGRRTLKDGERVLFVVTPHEKGLQAEQVSVLPEQ
jgi:CspA family cold shock protein